MSGIMIIQLISGTWLSVLISFGTVLNGAALLVFVRNKAIITPNNIFVIALLSNGFWMSTVAIYPSAVAEFSGGFHVLFNDTQCVLSAFVVYFVSLSTLLILLVITLTRYIAITKSNLASAITKKVTTSLVCLCYGIALVLATAPLLGWSSFGVESHGMSCGLDWQEKSDRSKSYLITVLLICFILPLTVMVVAYTRILVVIRNSSRSVSAIGRTSASNPHLERRERQLVKLSCLMVATFFLCWSPYAIVSFYVAFSEVGAVHPVVARIPPLVAKSEVLWNPLIYAIRDTKFRERVKAMLPVFKCTSSTRVENILDVSPDVSQLATIGTGNSQHQQTAD